MSLFLSPVLRARVCDILGPVSALSLVLACSAGADKTGSGRDAPNGGSNTGSGASIGVGGSVGIGVGGNIGISMGGVSITPGNSGGISNDPTCATQSSDATLVTEPVDIVVILDNSGSMEDELDAVEKNINLNFATILQESQVDYRLILISRHRVAERTASEEASTSICVQAPLSGLATCPAARPVFSDRFFQYSTKVESTDSFDIVLDSFAPPFEDEDKYDLAPNGWSAWLRPGAKKVFLELTDDDEDMTADAFIQALISMGPQHFGTNPNQPNLTFHSIIGVVEKTPVTDPYRPDEPVQTVACANVTTTGATYQDLSKKTGGLRFPICQFAAYDVVFRTIAEDVIAKRTIQCDFAIPQAPADRTLDLTKVAVNYVKGDSSGSVKFLQAATPDDCQPDAFYIADNRIYLCPEACGVVQADPKSTVDVLFTCESTIIVK
jgi:hypothetical protein